MKQQNNIKIGIVYALITSIISGIALFYAKISLTKLSPLILVSSRNGFVGLLFLLYFFVFGKLDQFRHLQKKELSYLLIIGLIGGSIPFYLFFSGLQLTTASVANLIHKTLFIWVTVMAFFFLKEKLSLNYLISFILIFIASFVIGTAKLNIGRGELMILLATILWAGENILAKKILKTVSSEMVGLFRMAIGGLTLILLTVITGKGSLLYAINPLTEIGAGNLTVIIVGGSILFGYVYCWFRALKYAPASLVSLLLTFSVVVGNILTGRLTGVKLFATDFYTSALIISSTLILILVNLKTKISNVGLRS